MNTQLLYFGPVAGMCVVEENCSPQGQKEETGVLQSPSRHTPSDLHKTLSLPVSATTQAGN